MPRRVQFKSRFVRFHVDCSMFSGIFTIAHYFLYVVHAHIDILMSEHAAKHKGQYQGQET